MKTTPHPGTAATRPRRFIVYLSRNGTPSASMVMHLPAPDAETAAETAKLQLHACVFFDWRVTGVEETVTGPGVPDFESCQPGGADWTDFHGHGQRETAPIAHPGKPETWAAAMVGEGIGHE